MSTPMNILGGFYTDDALPIAHQDCVNQLLQAVETDGGRVPAALKPVPSNAALTLYNGAPNASPTLGWSSGKVQASLEAGGKLYYITNGKLYRATISGNNAYSEAITGDLFGRQPVSMAYMQGASGYDISIYTANGGWVYNTSTGVTDAIADFQGSFTCDFIDQYMIGCNADYWFTSDVEDARTFSVFDSYTQEASADKIVAARVVSREVWVFGEKTTEVFYNAGERFARNSGAVTERGCANKLTIQVMNGIPFWLGDNGIIYAGNGHQPERISTHAIESAIAKYDWSKASSYQWQSSGHMVYCITFDEGYTFCFDLKYREWHRRESFGAKNSNIYATHMVGARTFVIDRHTSRLYEMRWNAYGDDDAQGQLVCMRRTRYSHNDQQLGKVAMVELVMNVGENENDSVKHEVLLRYSDDGGRNWSSYRKDNLGKAGEYNRRIRFYNLGTTRCRVFEIATSGKVQREFLAMNLDIQ